MTMLILGNLSVERLVMEMLLELFYRWGCKATLAGSIKGPKLELPRAWEPLDKS